VLGEFDKMEELSYAYLHALAAKEGFRCVRPMPDRDSIDVEVQSTGKLAPDSVLEGAMVQFQMKAIGKDELGAKEGKFSYSKLKIKNYNDLRPKTAVPRLLAVLVMPKKEVEWLSHSINELVMKRCMYWYSLFGLPEIQTDQLTTTVHIPEAQTLTPSKLKELLVKASYQEDLTNEF
jgi:hypothetical protein